MYLREHAVGHLWVQDVAHPGGLPGRERIVGRREESPSECESAVWPSQLTGPMNLTVRGCQMEEGAAGEASERWDGTFGQLGPICCHFHGQTLELSGMKLSTDQVPPKRQGSLRPGAEMQRGWEWEGWPRAMLGCFWVQMEGEWKGAGPAPPPQPLPTLLSPQTSRGPARPQCCQAEPGLAPLYPRPLGVKVGGGGQAEASFRS